MAKGREPVAATYDQVCALLERYACPVSFHEVRTRFLGNIASLTSASPLDAVKELWGGELPEFSDIDAANELIGALVMGLWNRLTRHQDRAVPFRLVRVALPETQEGLHRLLDAQPRDRRVRAWAVRERRGGRFAQTSTQGARQSLGRTRAVGGHTPRHAPDFSTSRFGYCSRFPHGSGAEQEKRARNP